MPKLYIKEDEGYYRVYLDYELTTIHHLHSEKLSKENADRLLRLVKKKTLEADSSL